MLTAVAILILGVLVIGGEFRRTGLAAVSIFPILIMITIVEKFVAVQIEKGDLAAIKLAIETLIISIVGFFIASSHTLINFLALYPWIVLLTIPINIMLGKWTGLRVSEYFRFHKIMKNL